MGLVRLNGGYSGVNGLSQKSIKLFCDWKDSPKRSEFFGFYLVNHQYSVRWVE